MPRPLPPPPCHGRAAGHSPVGGDALLASLASTGSGPDTLPAADLEDGWRSDLTMSTHDEQSDQAEIEGLRQEVARLEAALRAAELVHRRHLEAVRSSVRYRIGSIVVSLRHLDGWRRLTGELRTLLGTARRRRRTRPSPPATPLTGRSGLVVDSILDEFSHRALGPEVVLRPIIGTRPTRSDADLFLAESAWVGNGGTWRHQFSQFEPRNELDRLIDRYLERGVPTVFWNKEDPPHFETFLQVAARFDHVFTTDADCVQRYRTALGHDRIGVLPFAAQPAIHNPIGRPAEATSICFAGAWRGDVHPQRIDQITVLLDAAVAVGALHVFARHSPGGQDDFPERYGPYVRGEIPYDRMLDEYRRHACFLNVNTVTTSPTMMSRRVFEILACRTPVVSAPSPAIDELFDGIVPTPATKAAATVVLSELVHDPDRRDRLGQQGFRTVMSHHTYQHRFDHLCHRLGIAGFPSPALPTVDAVLEVDHRDEVPRAIGTVEPLRHALESVVVVCRDGGSRPTVESRGRQHVIHIDRSSTATAVLGLLPGTADFTAFLDPHATYGSAMITDAMLATRFSDADVYGKATTHAASGDGIEQIGSGDEFRNVDDLIDGTAIVHRRVLSSESLATSDHPTLRRAVSGAANSRFAVDRFNHVAGPSANHRPDGTTRPVSDAFC